MTPNTIIGAAARPAGSPTNKVIWATEGHEWFITDDSAHFEPLMAEALTRFGQPISCSLVNRGWVFISHGQDSLCILEQIQQQQKNLVDIEHVVEANFQAMPGEFLREDPEDLQSLSAWNFDNVREGAQFAPVWGITTGEQTSLSYGYTPNVSNVSDEESEILQAITSDFSQRGTSTDEFESERPYALSTIEELMLAPWGDPQKAAENPFSIGTPISLKEIVDNYQRRIVDLETLASEEEVIVSQTSLEDFWMFTTNFCPSPQAGLILTDEGNLVAIWRDVNGSTVEVEFWGDGQSRLIVIRDPSSPLTMLPEITSDKLNIIGEKIGAFSFIQTIK